MGSGSLQNPNCGYEGEFKGAVYLRPSVQILRALLDYGKAYNWGTELSITLASDHDKNHNSLISTCRKLTSWPFVIVSSPTFIGFSMSYECSQNLQ